MCDIHPENGRVLLKVEQEGHTQDFESRAAIISSGFGGALCERLGLGRIGDFVLGAQAEVETNAAEVEVYLGQGVAPGFFAWLVPTSGGRGLAGLLTRRSPRAFLLDFLSMLEARGKIRLPAGNFAYGGIPLATLPKTYSERTLVVGDAAGQVKPTTGGGIYYGLIAARHAVATVQAAFEKGDLSARGLAGYERKWKEDLENELRIGQVARRLYESLSDKRLEHIFEVAASNGIHEEILTSSGFSFDWHASAILEAFKHKKMRRILWSLS